jgi:4-hydroxy-tetrahydrodipicolinate synthase
MTGFAFPEVLRAMVNAARAGDVAAGRALFARFLPLIVYEQQPALAVRKEIYRLRGLLECGRVRHPGGQIDPETAAELRAVIDQVLPAAELTRPLALG